MITISWHLLVYILIALIAVEYLIFGDEENVDYSIPIVKPFIFIMLAAFTLIWGGIFWW